MKEKTDSKKQILSASLINEKGEVIKEIKLDGQVFGLKENPSLIAQAVRVHLARKRAGTRKAKTRAEIAHSTRKIYKQKGTGRARHGDIKAPIYIGGGVAHGPKLKDYSLSFPAKMAKKALYTALSLKAAQKSITVAQGLEQIEVKTKTVFTMLLKANLADKDKKTSLLIVPAVGPGNVYRASKNIEGVEVSPVNQLSAYMVLKSGKILFSENALNLLGSGSKVKEKKTETKTEVKVGDKKGKIPVKKILKVKKADKVKKEKVKKDKK